MKNIKRIFLNALELPPDQRPNFIRLATRDSPGLLSEVETLIKHHEQELAGIFDVNDIAELLKTCRAISESPEPKKPDSESN